MTDEIKTRGHKDLGIHDRPVPPTEVPSSPLRSLIRYFYLSSSLVPIFTIEILLLLTYFAVSWFVTKKATDTLLAEVSYNVPHIALAEAKKVDYQLKEISRSAGLLQREHQRFFADPSRFALPAEEPVFSIAKNGVFYKKNETGGSLFYSATTKVGETEKAKARESEAFDPLLKYLVDSNPNVTQAYFNSYDDMNRIYPFIQEVYEQFPPDLHMEDYNFYYMADAEHNPERKAAWTGAYLDPAGQGWMISCVVPVYRGDFLEGVTGLDVTIERFVNNILNIKLPWDASAFLVDESGTILAMPEPVEAALNMEELRAHVYNDTVSIEVLKPEEFNLTKNQDAALATAFKNILSDNTSFSELSIGGKAYMLAQADIEETGWRLMILVDRSFVVGPVNAVLKLAHQVGYLAIGLMLLFYLVFFLYLLRKSERLAERIAAPVKKLASATEEIERQSSLHSIDRVGIDELDRLTDNFNQMSDELSQRTEELVESQLREQMQAKEAQLAYNTGLYESASAYLHNIGNTLVGMDAKLLAMDRVLDSTKQYPAAMDQIQQAHQKAITSPSESDQTDELLSRFRRVLIDRALPRLREQLEGIKKIRDILVQSIKHQQETFRKTQSKRMKHVESVQLRQLLESVIEGLEPRLLSSKVEVKLECQSDITVHTQRMQLFQGLTNLIINAVEAIEEANREDGRIEIEIAKTGASGNSRAIILIRDNGIGVRPEHQCNLFRPGFTTKPDGHGLGLHSFANFLNENNGSIRSRIRETEPRTEFIVEVGNE